MEEVDHLTHTPASLVTLPAETVLQICSYLSQKDAANFRLTSKCYADLGAERLVKELHLMFRPKSLQNLLQIAAHPVFPKHVNSIFYEGAIAHFAIDRDIWAHHANLWANSRFAGRMKDDKDLGPERPKEISVSKYAMAQWEREMQHWELWYKKKPKYSKTQLTRGWSTFEHIQEESGKLAESDEDLKAIKAAFEQFPNLKEITMHTDCKASEAMLSNFEKCFVLATDDILPAIMPEEDRGFHSGTRQLSAILEASVAADLKLRSLTAGRLDWAYFGIEPIMYHDVQEDRRFEFDNDWWAKPYERRLEPAFHNLHHLDFQFEFENIDEELDLIEIEARHSLFGQALMSAKNLKSLVLNFGDTDGEQYYEGGQWDPVGLGRLTGGSPFDKVLWANLNFLELHSVGATPQEWQSFFEVHAPTLQTLHLSSLCLTGLPEDDDLDADEERKGISWAQLLTSLKIILHGKHIEFRGVFYVEDDFVEETYENEDTGWMDMDLIIPSIVTLDGPRFGKLVQEWFVDDLGTENNPITKYGMIFRHFDNQMADEDDDEEEDDEDEEDVEDQYLSFLGGGVFPGPPVNPQILAHIMAYSAAHIAHPTGGANATDDVEDDDDDEMPPLIGDDDLA